MIQVIHAVRANLIRREIEDKVLSTVMPKPTVWHAGPAQTPRMYLVSRLLRRFDQVRRQRWALWKDNR